MLIICQFYNINNWICWFQYWICNENRLICNLKFDFCVYLHFVFLILQLRECILQIILIIDCRICKINLIICKNWNRFCKYNFVDLQNQSENLLILELNLQKQLRRICKYWNKKIYVFLILQIEWLNVQIKLFYRLNS